ncbi:unnamed protein product [Rotaria magnacalcarata]|nr:unnamed protein product [Rotaria magnacalcarata]CAF4417896.1 unnamed protein product [Rotaria magnacalcarata]CAF4658122.1 unnamed protein product [Rotaria magnacalcarata]
MDQSSSSSISSNISASTSSSIVINSLSSSSSTQSTNPDIQILNDNVHKYTTETVKLCLKYKKNLYKIVDKKSKSPCWSIFGLPAKIVGNGYEIIKSFASCETCYQTYSYSSTISTLSNHKCPMITNKSQQKLQLSSTSRIAFHDALSDLPKSTPPDPNNIKISEKEKNLFKTSLTNWICLNIRPINIIEDEGLKSLIDLSIRKGYMHGPVSVSSLFPCRKTITKEIQKIGMTGRDEMKTVLIKAAKERRLSLSPDLWSDAL